MRGLFAFISMVVLSMASCAGPRVAEPAVRSTVHHLLLPTGGGGSMTSIAPGYVAATRHQFRGDELNITFEFRGETFRMMPIVGGDARELRLVATGSAGIITDDWVVIAADLPGSPYEYDPFAEVPPGTRVILAGYPVELMRHDGSNRPVYLPVVLESRVVPERQVRNASLSEGWEWGDSRKLICRLSWPNATLGGLSGGAAFAWDEARLDWIIVGIVYGTLQQLDDRTGEVVRQGRHVVVIRPDLANKIPAPGNDPQAADSDTSVH